MVGFIQLSELQIYNTYFGLEWCVNAPNEKFSKSTQFKGNCGLKTTLNYIVFCSALTLKIRLSPLFFIHIRATNRTFMIPIASDFGYVYEQAKESILLNCPCKSLLLYEANFIFNLQTSTSFARNRK